MGFMDSIRAKVELYRLEQRYARREKRTTFATSAQYVDGEYIFAEPPPPASSSPGPDSNPWSSKRAAGISVKEMMVSKKGVRV